MALAFQSIQPLLQASVVKPGANGSVKVQRSAGATRDSVAASVMGVGAVLGAGFCRSQARTFKSNRRGRGKSGIQMLHQVSDHEISVSDDQLVRYMGGNVVVRALCATELVQKVIGQHQCSPMAGIALGRALLATTLLANGRDEGESLQLRIQGDGPIGSIITEASSALTVRGMVGNPAADAPSVPDLVGVGSASTLRLTRTHPYWKRPYTGTIGLKSGEIAEDVAQYLGMSEQTPASMGLSVEWDSEAVGGGEQQFFWTLIKNQVGDQGWSRINGWGIQPSFMNCSCQDLRKQSKTCESHFIRRVATVQAGCVKQAEGWLVTLLPGRALGEAPRRTNCRKPVSVPSLVTLGKSWKGMAKNRWASRKKIDNHRVIQERQSLIAVWFRDESQWVIRLGWSRGVRCPGTVVLCIGACAAFYLAI